MNQAPFFVALDRATGAVAWEKQINGYGNMEKVAITYHDGVLQPGYALTVEPGLYFQTDDLTVPEELRGIGVRIEDDVVVTTDGCRNLTAALPRSADDVEAWMASL